HRHVAVEIAHHIFDRTRLICRLLEREDRLELSVVTVDRRIRRPRARTPRRVQREQIVRELLDRGLHALLRALEGLTPEAIQLRLRALRTAELLDLRQARDR